MSTLATSVHVLRARRRVPSPTVDVDGYYLAGHKVPAGVYQHVGGQRRVVIEQEGVLPASCDGKVAVYLRRPLDRLNRTHHSA